MKQIKIYFWVAVILLFSVLVVQNQHLKKEKKRTLSNQATLLKEAKYYQNKYGESQSTVDRLLLTQDEMNQYKSDLVEEVTRLGIKLKRLQSITSVGSETLVIIKTVFKDSLIMIENLVIDTIRCVEYKDDWVNFIGCEKNNKFDVQFAMTDTLMQIVHRVPKQWLFFRWGCKAIRQEIISKNPHVKIFFNEYIELAK